MKKLMAIGLLLLGFIEATQRSFWHESKETDGFEEIYVPKNLTVSEIKAYVEKHCNTFPELQRCAFETTNKSTKFSKGNKLALWTFLSRKVYADIRKNPKNKEIFKSILGPEPFKPSVSK